MRRSVFEIAIANLRNFHRLKISHTSLAIVCLIVAGIIGYVDYVTGYEHSMLLFYFLPISLAAWFGNFAFGMMMVVVCVTTWVFADIASGIPAIGFWNIGISFASYTLFAGVVSKLGTLVRELDRRVDERTAAYEREMVERRRLDEEIAQVADRERRRLGHDLHDKLGQHLTGTALAAQVLKEKLAARCCPETNDAEKLVQCLEEGIDFTRNLARGFFSPELRAEGLVVALQNLAETISEQSDIKCVLHGDELIPIHDATVANQLYRIAQEAVTNSIKHAGASHIHIRLAMDGSELCLSIVDDGVGFPDKPRSEGLGLHLMRHAAALSGGSFNIRRNGARGTIATCRVTQL